MPSPAERSQRRPLVLEFVGLPGAGKTTLARQVAERLAAEGYRCGAPRCGGLATAGARAGRPRHHLRLAAAYLGNWRLALTVLRFGLAIRPLRPSRVKWLRELLDFVHGIRAAGARHDLIVLDQAFLQAIWSATVHGSLPPAPLLERLIARAISASGARVVFLHLIVDPETALERIAGRQSMGSRFDRLPREEGAAQLVDLQGRVELITASAARATGAPVVRLDGSVAVTRLTEQVVDVVAAQLDESAARPERLALFLPDLTGGGAERVMVNLARGLVHRGRAVDLVLVRAAGPLLPEVPPGVRVVELGSRSVLASLPALVRYLRRERPRALLSTLNTANVVAVWAGLIARSPARIVVRQSNTLSRTRAATRGARRLIPFLVRHSYRWADEIVAVSEGVARDLVRAARLHGGRIRVTPNPVVTPELLALAHEPPGHPWFGAGEPPVVLGVGRLTRQKDFGTLIRAFARVRSRRGARLVILGEGEERRELEALVRALGLEDDVALPGFVPNPFAYMARAAVFVLSSAWEGLPAVVIQALAVGVPVIATDCESGPREILGDGRLGLLVPVGDEAAIERGILDLLGRPGPPVPREAWHRFTHEHAVTEYLRILDPGSHV